MNSAPGAGLKKKKKKKTQTLGAKRGSKPNLSIMNYLLFLYIFTRYNRIIIYIYSLSLDQNTSWFLT